MIDLQTVERQLKAVGCNYRFFGRPEIRELAHILMPDETITQAVNGSYEGGFAMLCVTDKRLLLIDKKPLFLTLEDIRYDMVAEIDYNYRLLNASVRIFTPNKELGFTSWNQSRLRKLIEYLQARVMEIRQHGHDMVQGQFAAQYQMFEELPSRRPAAALLPLLGKAAFHGQSTGSTSGLSSGRLVTPPRTANPYTKQPLPLSRRRPYPVY